MTAESGTRRPRLADFEARRFQLARWIFLRLMGIIYLVAFTSFATQVRGLVGEHGILPAAEFLNEVRAQLGGATWIALPTLGWISASDTALLTYCWAGVFFALLATIGVCAPLSFAACWVLYLSLIHIGQDFLSFQWDILLLETGFLTIFFAPWQLRPRLSSERPPSKIVLFLLWWLLFRLMFSSGMVKLNDPTWTHLNALRYHYETQPLPTVIGWYVHHLPDWFQRLSVAGMFIVELAVPFLIFTPRRTRMTGAALMISLQTIILLTGNYTFFNWLTIALCFLLFDNRSILKVLPLRFRPMLDREMPTEIQRLLAVHENNLTQRLARLLPHARVALHAALAVLLLLTSLFYVLGLAADRRALPGPFVTLARLTRPYFLVNHYGLFAQMTTERDEIILEGSADGSEWKPYEFRYKPGALDQPPRWVAPFQPRLDWQMWFAALSSARQNPWFMSLAGHLLRGTPEVVALLAENPFPGQPPKYIRAEFFQYHFASMAEHRVTGAWYTRTWKGLYLNPVSLK